MERLLITLILTCLTAFLGFLAQRSRMCVVGGFRDFILVGDRELLMGLVSLLVSLWLFTSIFYSLGWLNSSIPQYGEVPSPVAPAERSRDRGIPEEGEDRTEREIDRAERKIILIYPYAAGGKFLLVSLAGGFLIGVLSVQAGGCVLRQHVMAAQGTGDALYFLGGFYTAVLAYDFFLRPFVERLY